jgi:dipeptidyl aminopeptidase/acylaminoacyl peptidase
VVVALHGGPDQHWTLEFAPLFQMLAHAGLAVVAPNQRGSTGYGTAHARAIIGAWGGPDLADIRELGRTIVAARDPDARRPAVYGSSYGGFLALLTAAADPDGWSACAAVAPFRSVESLYAQAGRPTRNLIDRLDGHPRVDDELGPRDLGRLVSRIRASVLIAHGLLDETIPVTQSRELVDRLVSRGHHDVTYREPPNRGHLAFRASRTDPLALEITRFLAQYDDVRPLGAAASSLH